MRVKENNYWRIIKIKNYRVWIEGTRSKSHAKALDGQITISLGPPPQKLDKFLEIYEIAAINQTVHSEQTNKHKRMTCWSLTLPAFGARRGCGDHRGPWARGVGGDGWRHRRRRPRSTVGSGEWGGASGRKRRRRRGWEWRRVRRRRRERLAGRSGERRSRRGRRGVRSWRNRRRASQALPNSPASTPSSAFVNKRGGDGEIFDTRNRAVSESGRIQQLRIQDKDPHSTIGVELSIWVSNIITFNKIIDSDQYLFLIY